MSPGTPTPEPSMSGAEASAPDAGAIDQPAPEARRIPTDIWERTGWIILVLAFAIGMEIRANLLPSQGLRGDLDQFVGWVHHIAVHGLGSLYAGTDAGPVTFGPVMAYIWALLAAVQPGFATATDASDETIRIAMKLPACAADIALAAIAAYALRRHPKWAALAAIAILVHPAVVDVSAWWGQFDSIFVVSALAAVVFAVNGRNGLAAAFIAVSLMTKPQAIPFLIPFAAWFWATGARRPGADGAPAGARGGLLELAKAGVIGVVVTVALWLPFIPSGGPVDYLHNLGTYQSDIFNVISVRAWNVWWVVQVLGAPPNAGFVADDVAFLGPLTLRYVGYLVTIGLSLVIAWAILRDPRPRTLVLGLTASVLVFFTFMTQMHERYAYAALVLLVLLLPETRPRWLWLGFGVAFTLNLLAAAPPTPEIGQALPIGGALGIAGSIAMIVVTFATLRWTVSRDPSETPSALGA